MNGNGYVIIEKALAILGEDRPNVLVMGADLYDYLLFWEGDPPTEEQEMKLDELGVRYVAKFECYGIEREILWKLKY